MKNRILNIFFKNENMELLIALGKDLKLPVNTLEVLYKGLAEDKKKDLTILGKFILTLNGSNEKMNCSFNSIRNFLLSVKEICQGTNMDYESWHRDEGNYFNERTILLNDIEIGSINDMELKRIMNSLLEIVNKINNFILIDNAVADMPDRFTINNRGDNLINLINLLKRYESEYSSLLKIIKMIYKLEDVS